MWLGTLEYAEKKMQGADNKAVFFWGLIMWDTRILFKTMWVF